MKVVEESETKLVIKQGIFLNIILGILIVAAGVVLFFIANTNVNTGRIFALALIIAGIISILLASATTITVDKTTNKIAFLISRLWGKKLQEMAINQVKEISLEEYVTQNYSDNRRPRSQLNFTLVYYLQDGQGIPFRLGSQSNFAFNGLPIGMFLGRNKNVVMGNKIAAFIGVPFVDRRPPTAAEVITDVVQAVQGKKPLNEIPNTQNNQHSQASTSPSEQQ